LNDRGYKGRNIVGIIGQKDRRICDINRAGAQTREDSRSNNEHRDDDRSPQHLLRRGWGVRMGVDVDLDAIA
jgi:hypothetical protein